MTDFNAQQLSHSRTGKKGGTEWFGQIDAKTTEVENSHNHENSYDAEKSSAPYGRIAAKPTRSTDASGESVRNVDDSEAQEVDDKTFYMKIGLVFVGTLALVFVIFGLIWAILGSGDSEEISAAPELRESIEGTATSTQNSPAEALSENTLTLVASGNVYVLVKQQADNQELLRKTLSAGESITLEKDGAVDILFTAGENLVIEHGGERLRPSTPGTAKITIQ
jgi:hypothetical protein